MSKPFVLFPMQKKSGGTSLRLKAALREQVRQCEWLEPPANSSPESALGLAVLQRAVLDLITPGVQKKDRDSAFEWICGNFGDEFERDYALSFSRIVESFSDLPVNEFREKVLTFAESAKVTENLADAFRFQRG